MFKAAIITSSESGFAGKREDVSGAVTREILEANGYEVSAYTLVTDSRVLIADELRRLCDGKLADLVVTTGGTGFSPRDCTPEATLDVADRIVPGIPEAMRAESLKVTPRAMLSRAVSVIRGRTLIVNLPGSPKAVREGLTAIMPALKHGLEVLAEQAINCAEQNDKA